MLVKRVSMLREIMPGTYVLFFPSYGYMDAAASALAGTGARLLVQRPGMDQGAREAFMSELEEGGRLVLTVSGGIFSEGVDLRAPDLRGPQWLAPPALRGPEEQAPGGGLHGIREERLRLRQRHSGHGAGRPGRREAREKAGRQSRRAPLRRAVPREAPLGSVPGALAGWIAPRQVSWSMKEIGEFWAGGSSSSGEEGPAQA